MNWTWSRPASHRPCDRVALDRRRRERDDARVESASQPGRKRTKRDTIRLLHRYPARGYTDDPAKAAFAEPEAISAEDQEWIAHGAHRAEREAQLLHWRERRALIEKQIDWLYSQRFARDVSKSLRVLRRQLDHIEQRIRAV
jgi:hypothetical protein